MTAPIVAMVVAAVDGVRDNDERKEFPRRSLVDSAREPNWIFGNYVVLDAGRGIFVLLAHLRKGSIVVSRGDTVKEGAILGHAGNSGNSMLPHVHVQVMDRADPSDPDVSGVPARFRDFIEVMVSGDGRERDSVYRKVASGDPPEGAIVATPEPARPAP